MDITQAINKILSERLEQFKVPAEVRNNITAEVLAAFNKKLDGPAGTYVYRPEQSMAADSDRGITPASFKKD